MPTSLGPAEILVILVVALIVLGPQRLPNAARQVGKAFGELKRWSTGIQDEVRDAFNAAEPDPPTSKSGGESDSSPDSAPPMPSGPS